MKFQACLTAPSAAWEQILLQEGISWTMMDPVGGDLSEECSVLVVTGPLASDRRTTVKEYLRKGGGILGSAGHLAEIGDLSPRSQRIEYLVSGDTDADRWISLLDLGVTGDIPREAGLLRTQENSFALFAGQLLGGWAVILPFDVGEAFSDTRIANKNFYSRRERLPSERVALVGKGEILHLVHGALEFLHHARGFPYCHLWYFPDGRKNLFAFRVDTDGAPRADVDALYGLAREYGVQMSWYLDVGSHEPWVNYFATMVDQEIGVHCYEHKVFDTFQENLRNISRARKVLEEQSIRPKGFTAPYGVWNADLGRALRQLGFSYSSEFTLAYDALPFFPVVGDTSLEPLQVPIHPICPGSLRKIGYGDDQMDEYYSMVIDEKLLRGEPLFFYHHPTHRSWETVRRMMAAIKQRNIECTTLGAFAAWWQERRSCLRLVSLVGHQLITEGGSAPGAARYHLRVSKRGSGETIAPWTDQIDLNAIAWTTPKEFTPPADLRRIREFDPRAVLGDLYTRMVRRFR